MKIFVLAVGDRRRASSRLRVWDHVEWLRAKGYDVTIDYVMPPNITRVTVGVVWRIFSRWPRWAFQFFSADRVLIQETLLLGPLLWTKRWGKPRRVVFDFSDPVDTIGSGVRNRMQQLGFAVMTRGADHVIVENVAYITALRRRGINASQFYGPVDVDRYQASARDQPPRARQLLRIGWTGSSGTLSFIKPLFPVLDNLAKAHRIELMLIGIKDPHYRFKNLAVHTQEWSESLEFQLVPTFDLGLFMLNGDSRAKFRGAGKLFIYMAAGVPFVASNFGIAADIMKDSTSGFPVNSVSDWGFVLHKAITDSEERAIRASNAALVAKREMSYASFRSKLLEILINEASSDNVLN
jgi:hypothetical protein